MSDVINTNVNPSKSRPDPEPPFDSSLVNEALKTNYIHLNRELFYVQELLNSNTSWELEHKISNGTNLKIRGIFVDDDVSFQVSNSFGTGGMNDTAVGKVANSMKNIVEGVQAYAPVTNSADRIGNIIGSGIKNVGNRLKGDSTFGNSVGTFLENAGRLTQELGGDVSNFLNKGREMLKGMSVNTIMNGKFLAASDLIKTFQGTDAKFSLPTLKCWIFHNSQDLKSNVLSMVKAITSTCMGDLTDAEGIIGLQHSPGHYQPDIQVLNKSHHDKGRGMEGTWNLTMGGYTIYNLLITNVDVSLSKFNALDMYGKDSGDPLYAELSISIEPASYISRDDLFNTIMHRKSTSNDIVYHEYVKPSEPTDSSSNNGSKSKSSGKGTKGTKDKKGTKGYLLNNEFNLANKVQVLNTITNHDMTLSQKKGYIDIVCNNQAVQTVTRERKEGKLDSSVPIEDQVAERKKMYKDDVEATFGGYGKCSNGTSSGGESGGGSF